MLFLIDAQLPPALADWFRAQGHEAAAVRDIGLRDATDAEIWAAASARNAIVVTKDEDFVQLASADAAGPAVLWVRTGNVVNRLLIARFEAMWAELRIHIESGVRIVEMR